MYNTAEIDEPEEILAEIRDFSPESNCKDLSRQIIIKKWNREMHSHLYFSYLEPFFRTMTYLRKNKIFEWVKFSFNPLNAVNHGNNEMVNLSRKPLAIQLD
jgi:hypothetical protein